MITSKQKSEHYEILDFDDRCGGFATASGAEVFFALEAPIGYDFAESVRLLLQEYDSRLVENELSVDTEVCVKFHVSDVTNQGKWLRQVIDSRQANSFFSILGQPPASGSKISMEAYHIRSASPIAKERFMSNALSVNHGSYKSLWVRNLPSRPRDSFEQTKEIFNDLSDIVESQDGCVRDNVVRTWLYMRDVDNNYQGMVDSRKNWFKREGLTYATHYIASTGIEGCAEKVTDLVQMDSLAVLGLSPDQVEYMTATDYLNPTYEYGVTFERATRIMYGDRSHYYISGTASIDNQGNILYVGNVEKQAKRTLVNIEALLSGYGAGLSDMKILIVYLRDVSDYERIDALLKQSIPGVPYIIVRGAVCRPLWLIEMEGIAISPLNDEDFARFCG